MIFFIPGIRYWVLCSNHQHGQYIEGTVHIHAQTANRRSLPCERHFNPSDVNFSFLFDS